MFDACAHVNGEPCLNDILDPGLCLIPLIFDTLLRFWTGKIRLVTDMKQAFLQINKTRKHRDYLHSIWYQEFNLDENIIFPFKRIVLRLTCSPFLLNATVKLHLEKFLPTDSFKKFIEKQLLSYMQMSWTVVLTILTMLLTFIMFQKGFSIWKLYFA